MEPLHFGDSTRPLFGLRHRAVGTAKSTCIVICPPWGPEYMRAYRGLRRLADTLANAGFETLRFDYSGTGDSEGQSLAARVEHWLADIRSAGQELLDLSGAPKLAFFGLRLGALLAQAAREKFPHPSSLIAWDAPDSGAGFSELMRRLNDESEAYKSGRRNRDSRLSEHAGFELRGHAWTEALAAGLAELPSLELQSNGLYITSSDHTASVPMGGLRVNTNEAARWQKVVWAGTPWLPVRDIETVVAAIAGSLP